MLYNLSYTDSSFSKDACMTKRKEKENINIFILYIGKFQENLDN